MKAIGSPSISEKFKPQLTQNGNWSTPQKSLFSSLKQSSIKSKSPVSLLTLPSESTRNRKVPLHKLNTEPFNLQEPATTKSKCQAHTISSLDKTKPMLPVLTSPAALNKFIIRGFKPSEATSDYIQSTKSKSRVSEQFFALKEKKIKQKTKSQLEVFERIKKCTVFLSDLYATRMCITDRSFRIKKSKGNIDEIKEANRQLRESKIKAEGKNLADMVLNMDQNENIDSIEDTKVNSEVSFHNLHNAIALRRILKGKGRYNEEDETLGINDVNVLRYERKETEYDMTKTMKHFKAPKFLKSKFGNDTVRKFRGVNGKFFGVIC